MSYSHYKDLFTSVKPIRGRATDIRPIGARRRDWEFIRMNGDVVECVLYSTPVVRYYPDGRIGLQCGGYPSPSTAEFIYVHSPFAARRKDHKVWVQSMNQKDEYPLPTHGETVFVLTPDNKWMPEVPLEHNKQVINKSKAKEARAPFMPFIKFMESFFKLSDGWLMDDTMAQFGVLDTQNMGWNRARYNFGVQNTFNLRIVPDPLRSDMLGKIENTDSEDTDGMMQCLCMMAQIVSPLETRVVRKETMDTPYGQREISFYDRRCDPKAIKAKLYRMVEKTNDVHDTVTVEYK